jgi:hypothetical protein
MIHPDDLPPEVRAAMRPVDPAAEAERAETERRLTARAKELDARLPREQARPFDPVESTHAIVDWIKTHATDLVGWQEQHIYEAFRKPPPKVDLPPSVDALDDDTYDAIRRRIAWLEDHHTRSRDEIGRLIGQLDDRDQAIARVRDLAGVLKDRSPYASHPHVIAQKILAALDTPEQQ